MPPPPPPYQVANPYAPAGRTSGLAIASMVCGIVGVPMLCGYGAGLVLGILALVFGYRSRRQIRESQGYESGEGMATAGIVLGWVVVGFSAVIVTLIVAVAIGHAAA